MAAALVRHGVAALATLVLAPVAGVALLAKPAWRTDFRERLGLRGPHLAGAVWVHGASVGEILAATRLLDALRQHGRAVVASTSTATGRAVLARARPDVPVCYAPLDHPWCAEAALARVAPAALVLVETELWPCWIAAASRRHVPVVVVSGRISERSLPRYQKLAPLLRGTFERLRAVGARSEADAERFAALGVAADRITVTGDLKLEAPTSGLELEPGLARVLAGAPFWVAASTRPGEEEVVLGAHVAAQRAGLASALVLAPRHLDRIQDVERLLAARELRWRRRSDASQAPLAAGEVLLLDTLGEAPAVIALARFAFVGGTLAPLGGHNVLEPAHAGRAVLFGPHVEAVREAAALLLACGGGRAVADARTLESAVTEWLRDPAQADACGAAAHRELDRHRGATERSRALVECVLAGAGARA
jgi:3-deoxy-D-manno-octulosonic-acid transferase